MIGTIVVPTLDKKSKFYTEKVGERVKILTPIDYYKSPLFMYKKVEGGYAITGVLREDVNDSSRIRGYRQLNRTKWQYDNVIYKKEQ